MKVFDDLKTHQNCIDCEERSPGFLCNLSPKARQFFQTIKIANTYQKGSRLFIEGQPAEGVFLLCSGRVKLTTHSRHGKALILGIATPGEVLGLHATVSNSLHETTAEVIEPCQVNFVKKCDFQRFLEQNADAGINAMRQMSLQYSLAFAQIRSLALSTNVAEKLARLLLGWSEGRISNNGSIHMKVTFSHEEMAEMIGTSRETVTRLLKSFRDQDLIAINGSDFFIHDRPRLALTLDNGKRSKPVH